MESFSEQCLDMARSMLSHNIDSINQDGSISPIAGEDSRTDEPGHAALAIGEFYRATGETELEGKDLIDLAARCVTAQVFCEPPQENGLAYAALGLLSFGPSKERNPVWERLVDETRERLDKLLLNRSDYDNHWQSFNIAKAVCRFSLGLSKKDETGRLIERFIERIQATSSTSFFDDSQEEGIGGNFSLYGVMAFVFTRQSLQLHSNPSLRERKLPSLRTFAEKYLKMLPDLVREDGLGWAFSTNAGAYGQMHLISLLLQGFRDGWIPDDKQQKYFDILRRLFFFFYATYLDQEHGYLVIRDDERTALQGHTTRLSNFDGARYLSQWARLSKMIKAPAPTQEAFKSGCRFVIFDKSNKKEQGLLLYRNAESNLQIQMPLVSCGGNPTADCLPFPHSPGVFDAPNNVYLPVMLPELTIDGNTFIPAYYGKKCTTGLGMKRSFYFRYEQPELITTEEKIISNVGSCKVSWTFAGNKIGCEFIYTVKNQVTLDRFRYVLAIGAPHSQYRIGSSPQLGAEGLRCAVQRDDFQGTWKETEVVTNDRTYRTNHGNLHYLQTLERDHPLIMRPGQTYRIAVSFDPHIIKVGDAE